MAKFLEALYQCAPNGESAPYIQKLLFVLIASGILLLIPLLIATIFPIFKEKLSQKGTVILYAFVTGFFLTMAMFGFLRESLETSSLSAQSIPDIKKWQIYGWNILLVGGGLIIGLLLAWGIRSIVVYTSKKKIKENTQASVFIHTHDFNHEHHLDNGEDHVDAEHEVAPSHEMHIEQNNVNNNPKTKVVALLLLLTHRIPEGFIIGYTLNNIIATQSFQALSLAFILSFIMHLIPEEIVFYYRQREMGIGRWKAMGISIGCLCLFIPMMFLGIYLGEYLGDWHARALIESMIAGIFIFTSIIEFLPEFYHAHHDKKLFKTVLVVFMVGVALSVIVLCFHQHGVQWGQ